MRITSLIVASIFVSVPAGASAQGADVPVAPLPPPSSTLPPTSLTPTAPTTAGPAIERPAAKNGAYMGFSFGTGKGTLYSGSSSLDIDEFLGYSGQPPTTLNMQLRFGWGTGDLLFGTQMNLTRSWVDIGGSSYGLQFFALDLVTTWWSQEAGVYTRLGVGPAQFNTFAGDSSGRTYNGMELMLGGGFTMGGMGVGIDFFRQVYDANETGFDAVSYVLATLSLDLY